MLLKLSYHTLVRRPKLNCVSAFMLFYFRRSVRILTDSTAVAIQGNETHELLLFYFITFSV